MRAAFLITLIAAYAYAQQCYRASDILSVRRDANPGSERIQTIPAGTTVTRVGGEAPNQYGYVWFKVQYGGVTGWSASNWLQPTACGGATPPPSGGSTGTGGSCSFTMNGSPDFRAASTGELTKDQIKRAAASLGVDAASVKAVTSVEAGGSGFFADGRPKILYEAQQFYRLTNGRFGSCNSMSCSYWNRALYVGGPAEYNRLMEAYSRDQSAALQAASWGAFQIMGFNYRTCGYNTIESFIADMKCGHEGHMRAFLGFIRANGLDKFMRSRDWASFAYRYNGAGYAANNYDGKMRDAYNQAVAAGYNNEEADEIPVDELTQSSAHRMSKAFGHTPVVIIAIVASVLAVAVVIVAIKLRRARQAQSQADIEATTELL